MNDCQGGTCTATITATVLDVTDIPVTTHGEPGEATPNYGGESPTTTAPYPDQDSAAYEPASTSSDCTTSGTSVEGNPGTDAVVPTDTAHSNGPVYYSYPTTGVTASGTSTDGQPSGYEKSTATSASEGPSATPTDNGSEEKEQSSAAKAGFQAGIFVSLALGAMLAMI